MSWSPVVHSSSEEAHGASLDVILPPSPPESEDESEEDGLFSKVVDDRVANTILGHLSNPEDRQRYAGVSKVTRNAVEEEEEQQHARHWRLITTLYESLDSENVDAAATAILALLREPEKHHFLRRGGFLRTFRGQDVLNMTAVGKRNNNFSLVFNNSDWPALTVGMVVENMIKDEQMVQELAEAICTNLTIEVPREQFDKGPADGTRVFKADLLPAVPLHKTPRGTSYASANPMLITHANGEAGLHLCANWTNNIDEGISYWYDCVKRNPIKLAVFRRTSDGRWVHIPVIHKHKSSTIGSSIGVVKMVNYLLLIHDERGSVPGNTLHLRASFTDQCLK